MEYSSLLNGTTSVGRVARAVHAVLTELCKRQHCLCLWDSIEVLTEVNAEMTNGGRLGSVDGKITVCIWGQQLCERRMED
jgi:hypothetical protein